MRVLIPGVIVLILTPPLLAQNQTKAPGDLTSVYILDGSQSIQLKYDVASRRSHTGITSGKQYFVFWGEKAAVRTSTRTPSFEFETDAALDDPVYLFKFDTHSRIREIRVAKGGGGLAELSIPRDHLIQTQLQIIRDGPNATKLYRLKPTSALRPGEYCLGRTSYTCFDFGID